MKTIALLAAALTAALSGTCATNETKSAFTPYAWRGFMLDEARHFFGKEKVKEIIDLMAEHKMNVFHWHLTDDQGWRIDLPGLPELVRAGAVRPCSPPLGLDSGSDGKPYGPFFYTADEAREIVAYAAARGIRVMPEVDLPGHVRALLAAHPEFACAPRDELHHPWTGYGVTSDVLCIGNEEAVRYAERIIDAICEIFPSEYIHLGGDECPRTRWNKCPKCAKLTQAAFTMRMAKYLESKGRRMVAWDEVLSAPDLPKSVVIHCWRKASYGNLAAKRGHDVIMSPLNRTYLSIPTGEPDDAKWHYRAWVRKMRITVAGIRSFSPTAGIARELHKCVLGGECCAWTEVIGSGEELDFKIRRRMSAFGDALYLGPKKPAP